MLAGAQHGISKQNIVLNSTKDVGEAIELRRERQRNGQFRPLGIVESIVFEPDRAFDPALAPTDAKFVGRRLYWPDGRGPWLARSEPEGDLIFVNRLRLPLPRVPDVAADDPNRKPLGDTSDPAKGGLWKPGDKVRGIPMMNQEMERIASARFRNFLVFQPVAQIQFLMGGGRAAGPQGMPGKRQVMHQSFGNASFGAAGSHRMPLCSLRGWDDRTMCLLIDPRDGEALFLFGRYSVDLKG